MTLLYWLIKWVVGLRVNCAQSKTVCPIERILLMNIFASLAPIVPYGHEAYAPYCDLSSTVSSESLCVANLVLDVAGLGESIPVAPIDNSLFALWVGSLMCLLAVSSPPSLKRLVARIGALSEVGFSLRKDSAKRAERVVEVAELRERCADAKKSYDAVSGELTETKGELARISKLYDDMLSVNAHLAGVNQELRAQVRQRVSLREMASDVWEGIERLAVSAAERTDIPEGLRYRLFVESVQLAFPKAVEDICSRCKIDNNDLVFTYFLFHSPIPTKRVAEICCISEPGVRMRVRRFRKQFAGTDPDAASFDVVDVILESMLERREGGSLCE